MDWPLPLSSPPPVLFGRRFCQLGDSQRSGGRRERKRPAPGTSGDQRPSSCCGPDRRAWLILLGVPLPLLVAVGALFPATVASVVVFRAVAVRGKLLAGAGWIAATALLAVGALGHTYEPSRSSRLLFSTNVFMAWRNAAESRLLPFLDDSRLLAQREGECGTYTVWKQRGMQLSLRESGIPCGTFCPRPEIGPQFSGEIVPCLLPLVLHEAPRHVLILGLGSGSGLASCLEFPIEDVTCVEADRGLIDVLESTVWPTAEPNPRLDNRAESSASSRASLCSRRAAPTT